MSDAVVIIGAVVIVVAVVVTGVIVVAAVEVIENDNKSDFTVTNQWMTLSDFFMLLSVMLIDVPVVVTVVVVTVAVVAIWSWIIENDNKVDFIITTNQNEYDLRWLQLIYWCCCE